MIVTDGVVPADIHDLIDESYPKLTGMPAIDGREGGYWWKVQTSGAYCADDVIEDIQQSADFPQAEGADLKHIWLRPLTDEERQDHRAA
jgi:hypothetical protein